MNTTLLLILVVILLLAASAFAQFYRTRRSPLGRVLYIFSNIRNAAKLCHEFSYKSSVKKFGVAGWEKNKDKVDFLPEELRAELARLFGMMEDVNLKIDTAIKFKSNAYLVTIDVKNLEGPLAASSKRLRDWLQDNMHNPEYLPRRRSLFRW
jgi:hypothetical protein